MSNIYYSLGIFVASISTFIFVRFFFPKIYRRFLSLVFFKPFYDFFSEIQSDIHRLIIFENILVFFLGLGHIWFDVPWGLIFRILSNTLVLFCVGICFAAISVSIDYAKNWINEADMNDKDKSIAFTLIPITGSIFRYIVFVICAVMSIHIWGFDITPILTGTDIKPSEMMIAAITPAFVI